MTFLFPLRTSWRRCLVTTACASSLAVVGWTAASALSVSAAPPIEAPSLTAGFRSALLDVVLAG